MLSNFLSSALRSAAKQDYIQTIKNMALRINENAKFFQTKHYVVISFHEESIPFRNTYHQNQTLKRYLTEREIRYTGTGYGNGLVVDVPYYNHEFKPLI